MSRIRSIHPGIWTDEEFVSLSPLARLFYMGLWNECDDKGIFEWKPLTLKMRLLPADNADAAALLAELSANGCIRQYAVGGKSYGAVRNFGKFQRPKKPNDVHPVTAEILTFCAITSEPKRVEPGQIGNQFPTGGEIGAQMEDGEEEEEGEKGNAPPTPLPGGGEREYAFAGKVARLNRRDYDSFRARFHAIPDFDAALAACDGWLSDQTEAKQRKWFGSVAPWLEKRHQEALARAKPSREAAFIGPC